MFCHTRTLTLPLTESLAVCSTFLWNTIIGTAPLLSVSEASGGRRMEKVSVTKLHFLRDSFSYANLNRASPLNQDSFISSRVDCSDTCLVCITVDLVGT